MSAKTAGWNYRIVDTRPILVQSRDERRREIRAIDLKVNLPLILEVPKGVSMESAEIGKEFLAVLKVYTANLIGGSVVPELVEFFKVIEVERKFEEFLKAAYIDRSLFRFELIELEPM